MKKKWWKIVEKKERKKSVKNEKQNVFGETCKVRLLIFVSFRQVPWNLPTVKTIVLSFTIVIDLRRNISNEISIFDLLASFFFSHFFRNFFFFFCEEGTGVGEISLFSVLFLVAFEVNIFGAVGKHRGKQQIKNKNVANIITCIFSKYIDILANLYAT